MEQDYVKEFTEHVKKLLRNEEVGNYIAISPVHTKEGSVMHVKDRRSSKVLVVTVAEE